jgi:hypothetical protein
MSLRERFTHFQEMSLRERFTHFQEMSLRERFTHFVLAKTNQNKRSAPEGMFL